MGSNFLVYYFDMEGKAELNQNDSVYCTWFVRCNCPHLGYCIKFGFLTLSYCSRFGLTTSDLWS